MRGFRWSCSPERSTAPGSSRDWAAKGTALLGVRAVLAESFERIHRSNLIGMGVLPLQFPDGESAESLGLNGEEVFTVEGLGEAVAPDAGARTVKVRAEREGNDPVEVDARVRLDTPNEVSLLPQRRHPAPRAARPAIGLGHTERRWIRAGSGIPRDIY